MRMTEPRARIPLGAMKELWSQHQEFMLEADSSDSDCAICGKQTNSEPNYMLICDQHDCSRVQHILCSGDRTLAVDWNTPWYCRRCTLMHKHGLD